MDNDFKKHFSGTDIIAWNGIISTFSSISAFVQQGDNLRLAHIDEVRRYESVNKKI